MKTTINTTDMLNLLKEYWAEAYKLATRLGWADERTDMHCTQCVGMKEMCEALICAPVNLKLDGRVTIGLDEQEVEW